MIQISEYQPGWRAEFLSIHNYLTDRLGGLAKRVDHIGSTSVPDLCAKDILDIQVSVASLDTEVIREITACGFVQHSDVNADHVPPGYIDKAEEKKRLAVSLVNDAAYPEVKDPAVDLIYFSAEQWALQTGWSLYVSNP